ncbi:proteasome regulatory particle lid subunit RPN3 NDAI_0D00290 [Naumovozyma dairenensis CBS 421]|uniref:PCI domain-containing protein n=1 Tax=Naumovozyma dairenensis (strain ATCC 10597 / BCRC 20456 / CBS 421 / NBRC 0211 / NRRL Y-12639) TaxID=1071378 RepID=G0W982_NAUDC|nr:hypothetical protein NDAI_0D00290 [Naumovozyma dairenensis CBS 421]CCD24343.1 hypothetical protein NDAI_0D00290 [Naumovozyma dairenensis CBS 421]
MSADLMEVDSIEDVDAVDSINSNNVQVKYAEETIMEEIIHLLKEISKTTTTLDPRYIWRALKELGSIRKNNLSQESLSALVNILYPDNSSFKIPLLKFINENHKSSVPHADEIRSKYPASFYQIVSNDSNNGGKTIEVAPELNSFIHLLVQVYLLDSSKFNELSNFNTKIILPKILAFYNQRSLDLINAKLWFYIIIADEKIGNQSNPVLRSEMIKFLRTASLKHDNETRAMLITLVLRNFLAAGEIESASDFINKIEFPTTDVSSPLEARYYFYLSKISAIQLDYSMANEYIIAAIRKAPHNAKSIGFLQQSNKLLCVIQLLMGDIPELSFFNQKNLKNSLVPYYNLSKAVRLGDLKKFTQTITKYKKNFITDGNYQLCVRLRSNVIKTGIRIISLTYKKISLKDICLKLRLDSEQTAEYMVSRAIRDGVIEAKINHEKGFIETSELLNVYGTKEPQTAFDERIRFVYQLHDECIVAMRYPEDKKLSNHNGKDDDGHGEFIDGELFDELDDFSDIEDMDFM